MEELCLPPALALRPLPERGIIWARSRPDPHGTAPTGTARPGAGTAGAEPPTPLLGPAGSPREPPPHRGAIRQHPAAHLVEPVHDAPAGGARQAPPLTGAADGRRQQQGGTEQHGQGHARRPWCGARATRGAGPHGEGSRPPDAERGRPSRAPSAAAAKLAPPRLGPAAAGPRAPFRFPRQPYARTGRGRSLVEEAD